SEDRAVAVPREEELGARDVLGTDPEDLPEALDERPAPAVAEPVAEVGAGSRADEAEDDHQHDRVMAGRRPRRGCKQERLAGERHTGALDQDAEAGGGVDD